MAKKPKITKKKFKQACINSCGILRRVAAEIGVTSDAVYKYLRKHPDLREYLRLARQDAIDQAEDTLMRLMKYSDSERVRADIAKHVTSTLGKDRGWMSKTELSHEVPSNINIQILPAEDYVKPQDDPTEDEDPGE